MIANSLLCCTRDLPLEDCQQGFSSGTVLLQPNKHALRFVVKTTQESIAAKDSERQAPTMLYH